MNRLNNLGFWILMISCLTIAACQPKVEEDIYPTDLEGQRMMLAEKKTALKDLENLIEKLEMDIETNDPTVKNFKKVTTTSLEKKDIERFVEIQGSIVADDFVMASSEVGGRLTSMTIDEGDYIRTGQKIGSVDMESLKKQIEEINTSLELANELYDRQERLWKQNIGSEIQYLQAKNNKERLEKSLETIQFNLTKGDIFAPSSGVVEKVMLRAGEMAAPGSPILQILNVRKVKVSIDVPEKYLTKIKKGSKFKVELPTLEYEKTVRVTDIGRTIDPSNRTFKVEANISSNSGKIKPNLMAIAHISDFEIKDAIALDSELIQQDIDGSSFVYAIAANENGESIATKKYIELGESIDNQLIIESGLDGTEQIIVDGARIVNDGQIVTIENPENNG